VRERILDAALVLLSDRDVKRLAQPQVARLAGVPQGHLTYYFPKRRHLLLAVARRFGEQLRGRMPHLDGSGAARDEGRRFLDAFVRDRALNRRLLRLLVEADGDAELCEALSDTRTGLRHVTARALGRPEADPDVDVAMGTLLGLAMQHLLLAPDPEAEPPPSLTRMGAWLGTPPTRGPAGSHPLDDLDTEQAEAAAELPTRELDQG